jgi:hypothetical protein
MEMLQVLSDKLANASTKLGRTQILQKFAASRPSPDETVTQFLTKPIAFCKKLIGTTVNLTNDAMKTDIFTTLSDS